MMDKPVAFEHSPLEKRCLRRVIQEYQDRKYIVKSNPSSSDLPEFMRSTPPDLIAISEVDNVAVSVRTTMTLRKDAGLDRLAKAISDHPDWRLELIVTNPRVDYSKTGQNTLEHLNRREIYLHIATAQELNQAGYPEAAFSLLWSAIAATFWEIQARDRIPTKEGNFAHLLKQLVSMVVISEREYVSLHKAFRMQTLIAQGYQCEGLHPEFIRELSEITLRMLKS